MNQNALQFCGFGSKLAAIYRSESQRQLGLSAEIMTFKEAAGQL
jgi:hypothetical protein